MIIPEWLKDELEGKKYTPKAIPSIVDKGIRTTWEIPGLIGDMLNRDRGKGLKGGLAPRMSDVRKRDEAIRELGPQGIGGTPQTRPHNWFDSAPTTSSDEAESAITEAQNTKIANEKSIGAINARASLMKAAGGQSSSKGSVGQNLLTLQQMREDMAAAAAKTNNNNTEALVNNTTPNITPIPTQSNIKDANLSFNATPLNTTDHTKYNLNTNVWQQNQTGPKAPTANEMAAAGNVTFADRMQGAAGGIASAVLKQVTDRIAQGGRKKPNVNESAGALTGGKKPWEEMYAPQWYNV